MSVAGKRKGIKHSVQGDEETTRSGLFYEAVRIIKEMRDATNGEYPKYAVWENVCFAENTLITCENGYKPIENISVGEKVKTLSGKYMPVVKVHKTKRQNVFKLSASGGEDLIVTGNHPLYARQKIYDTGGRKTITDAQWTEVKDLTEKHLIAYRIDEPILPENFISEIDAWLLGRWLADGSVDLTKATPRIFISVGNAKLEDVRNKLRSSPYELSENAPHETATNFTFTSNEFYSLIAECGVGAGQKKVASYIFTLPHRLQKCILDGYMSGDGYMRKRFNGTEITAATASRELAYGIARLIRNCYKTSANISCRPARNGLIDGRVIKANYPSYNITACIGGKSSQSFFDGEFVWQPVRSMRPLKEKQDVYNLSVLEDNTYAANDIICHNCGAFSSNKGHDFHAVLEALCSVCDDTVSIPEPYDAKRTKLVWNNAGEIVGDNYSVAWRTLDAQYWGVPQRRKRIYLVADFTGRRAGEILFKPDSLPRNLPQSDEAGQEAAVDAMGGVDGSVGVECIETVTLASSAKNAEIAYNISPCLMARAGTGGNQLPLTVYSFDSLSSNIMKSSNPNSGCRAVKIAKCIDTTYPDPSKNQGGVAIVQPLVLKERAGCEGGGKGALWSDKAFTLATNQDMSVIALQANGIDRADTAGCNGFGWRENESYTLNTIDRHAVCYDARNHNAQDISGTIQAKSNGGQSLNYINPVCYDARENGDGETACTITGDHQNRVTDYTAVAVQETLSGEDVSGCLKARDYKGCEYLNETLSKCVIQTAKPPRKYIIRRLTPTECARLQGFPDNWGHLAPYNPADAEFWEDVRKTHAEINGKPYKPTKNLKKWYEGLHTDSAEYKMWGNGIALPNAEYVLHGIAEQGAKTLGSLFDGSGGFPLSGALNGITPLWSSEVEPYPIAVTVSRFGIENAPTELQLR